MRKNGLRLGAACAALVLTMTGCGNQIPDLTEEEMQMVGEYAAITLLKYDANHRSRLVDAALVETEEAEKDEELTEETPETKTEELKSEETPESTPVVETPVIDAEEVPVSAAEAEVATFYDLPENVEITYKGYEISTSYPSDSANGYLTVEAEQGKKLLILQFDISNGTAAEQAVDLFSSTAVYQVNVNGIYEQNALTTMLMNDMSTLVTTIPANGSQEVVLVVEIEEDMADSISTITLNMKNEPNTYTIQLL